MQKKNAASLNELAQKIPQPRLETLSERELRLIPADKLNELIAEREEWSTKNAYRTQLTMQTAGQMSYDMTWGGGGGVAKLISS
jgi:hypothetical protein